jgi:hypothetical protein
MGITGGADLWQRFYALDAVQAAEADRLARATFRVTGRALSHEDLVLIAKRVCGQLPPN